MLARDQLPPDGNRGRRNRRKGQDLERKIAKDLRSIGYGKTKTSRAGSKLLDDCGVDIIYGPPCLIQAKAGYARNRPKFEIIYDYIKEKIEKELPDNAVERELPIVLIHKLGGGDENKFTATICYNHWLSYIQKEMDLYDILQRLSDKNLDNDFINKLLLKYGFDR